MSLKNSLQTNKLTSGVYEWARGIKKDLEHSHRFAWQKASYKFINRSHGYRKMCVLLAGYKPFLYDVTFSRIAKYIDDDIDMCVVTSGLFSKDVSDRCERHGWSYLYTKANNVALVQNLAIWLHPKAEYIYKMDEDIFVTQNSFKTMYDTLIHCENEGEYNPLFVAPLLPINGFCYLEVLKKFNIVDDYERKFGKAKYACGADKIIENNPEVAKFFWGEKDVVPHIDSMNKELQKEKLNYLPCPIRYSIGFILLNRKIWDEMEGFTVVMNTSAMGVDEYELCLMTMKKTYTIIVSENCVCGHLGFGAQNAVMKQYFLENQGAFQFLRE